jgi:hypothetical protein
MPVRRFRSVEEIEDHRWLEIGSPALFRAIAEVWDFASRTSPHRLPPGVYRHRTIEDAQRLREQWEAGQKKQSFNPPAANP